MKGKIINFDKARIASYLRQYEKTGVIHHGLLRAVPNEFPAYARTLPGYTFAKNGIARHKYLQQQETLDVFNEDLEILRDSFKTEATEFMFPTIMCRYRKGMNPVRGLYYELQKTLFTYNEADIVHRWIISLFHDQSWYNELITALEYDYEAITKFQHKHLPKTRNKHIERELSVLNNVKENLLHFKEVFILMNGSCDRYL